MKPDRYGEIVIFTRIVSSGSFSAAARMLSLSPSAVSKLIIRLENRLGARLFNRTSRSLRLTADGEAFHASALRVVEAMEEAENTLQDLTMRPRGTLRIVAPPAFCYVELAPIMPGFLETYPDIRVEFQMNTEISDPVEAGMDVVIRMGQISDSTLIARKIGYNRFVICATSDYLRKRGTPRTPSDLLAHNCLSYCVRTRTNKNDWILVEDGVHKRIPVRGNASATHGQMLRELGLNSLGIIRLPDYFIHEDLRAGRLVPILEEFSPADEPIYALYLHQRNLSPRIRVFIDYLKEHLRTGMAPKPSRESARSLPVPASAG